MIDKVLVHKGFTTLHVLAIRMIALALFDVALEGLGPIIFLIRQSGSTLGLPPICFAIFYREEGSDCRDFI